MTLQQSINQLQLDISKAKLNLQYAKSKKGANPDEIERLENKISAYELAVKALEDLI